MKGLSPIRTARVIAGAFAISGGILLTVCLLLQKLLDFLPMAQGMVHDGLALYNSFSGRLAVSNIAGHKELLDQLNNMKQLLPSDALVGTVNLVLVVLMVVAAIILVVALVGLIRPSLMILVMLKLKLLSVMDENGKEEVDNGIAVMMEKLGNVRLKTLAIPAAIVAGIVAVGFGIYGISRLCEKPAEELVLDLEQKATEYVTTQKAFFGKNKRVGYAKDLEIPEVVETDVFEYNIIGNKFVATNRIDLNGCTKGNTWTISSYADGVFSKELKFSRKPPQDSSCIKLLPDFKNVGRRKR